MRWQRVFGSSLSFSELQQRANFQTTFKDSEGVADVGCCRWLLLPLHVTSVCVPRVFIFKAPGRARAPERERLYSEIMSNVRQK